MKNISLTEKLVLFFVILGIAAISVISSYSYHNARKAIVSRTFDQLNSLRVVKKNQLENFFSERLTDIRLLAGSVNYPEMFGKQHSLKNEADVVFSGNTEIIRHLSSRGYYPNLYLLTSTGEIFVMPLNSKGKDFRFKLLNTDDWNFKGRIPQDTRAGSPFIIDFTKTATEIVSMFTGIQLVGTGEKTVFVFLEIPNRVVDKLMFENNPAYGFGNTGDFYLVGSDYLMRSSSRFVPNSILLTQVKTKSVNEALKRHEGARIIEDYRNLQVLSSYSHVDIFGLNWAIIAEIDLSEAMIPIIRIRDHIFFMSLFITCILFMATFIFSRMITGPVIKLKKATEQIIGGDYNISLQVKTQDEIGILTDAFNRMSAELAKQKEELAIEQNRTLKAMIDGQDFERQRLSQELHDGLGQELIALKLRLESINAREDSGLKEKLAEIRKIFDKTINGVRRMSNNLMPAVLEEFGLIRALRFLCEDINESSAIVFTFRNENLQIMPDKRTQTYIYRIVQEAITNIVKHSRASEAGISIFQQENLFCLTIKDNGVGFLPESIPAENSKGLYNMKERIKLLNGQIEIESKAGSGTTILIRIPFFS